MQAAAEPTVCLIIPVYNESQHLQKFLTAVDALDLKVSKRLVIVDDHSTDDSLKIIRSFNFKSPVVIVGHEENRGKGAAIRTGIGAAQGDIIGIQDADFEYDMTEIPSLIQPILENKADVVYGSRFKKGGIQVHRTFHYLINRLLTMFSNLLSGLYLSDMETCYKFFRAEIIQNIVLETNRFGFEPEVTAKLGRLKVRLAEIPISYFPRNYLEGKKISWRDGVAALRHILYFNLCIKPQTSFKPDMPARFLVARREWL